MTASQPPAASAASAPEVDAAILRLIGNGAVAFGHPLFDRYREGWFNALGMLAGMLGNRDLQRIGYALGDCDLSGADLFAKAEELLGPADRWPSWPPASRPTAH